MRTPGVDGMGESINPVESPSTLLSSSGNCGSSNGTEVSIWTSTRNSESPLGGNYLPVPKLKFLLSTNFSEDEPPHTISSGPREQPRVGTGSVFITETINLLHNQIRPIPFLPKFLPCYRRIEPPHRLTCFETMTATVLMHARFYVSLFWPEGSFWQTQMDAALPVSPILRILLDTRVSQWDYHSSDQQEGLFPNFASAGLVCISSFRVS